MFKLLGQALAHSFGLVAIVLISTIGGTITSMTNGDFIWLYVLIGLYSGGYALLPIATVINKLIEGRTVRKQIKVEMASREWAKNFNYEISKKAQKQVDKEIVKYAKSQNKKVEVKEDEPHDKDKNEVVQEVQKSKYIQ